MYNERDMMTYSTGLRSAVCATALFAGTAAHADLTAAEVWEDWKSQIMVAGDDVVTIGSEESSSGVLTVRDIAYSFSDPEVTIAATIDFMTFNEQSDGSVRVTMDDNIPLTITNENGGVATIIISQENLLMTVAGELAEMDYVLSADSYGITFQDYVEGDLTYTGDGRLIATDIDGAYTVTTGELRTTSGTSTTANLDLLMDFQIPGGQGQYFTAAAKVSGMQTQVEATTPLEANYENPENIFNDGFSIAGGYTIESTDYIVDSNIEGDQFAMSGSSAGSSITFDLSKDTVGYDAVASDLQASYQASEIPFPVDVTMGSYGTSFRMPLSRAEGPSPFGMSFEMIDLEVSDMLWDIFDPGQVLPRDPATLQIDIDGTATPMFDFLDPSQAEMMADSDMPFELTSVSLETLRIMVAGALLTGNGAFTFDNSDMETFAPLPRPEGDASFEITGLNALLDNLVAMGLVAEGDVMGPRMMMGMFARATGDDQMAIDVEVAPNGQVNVNGNRVR